MEIDVKFVTRSLSKQESRVVLTLVEQGRREVDRPELIKLLEANPKIADHVIRSLRRKGWLERASWGKYLLVTPDQGPEAIGESNLLALASRIVETYYIGFGTAATHYGFTTQHRNVIWLVTPMHLRSRKIGDTKIQIVNPMEHKFFGYASMDVLGYPVLMSDREKTVIDCIDRPELAGGIGEVAYILATASHRLDWSKVVDYLIRIGSTPLIRRFGWLLDHVGADIPSEKREHLLQMVGKKRKTCLGPKEKIRGPIGYNKTWHLFVNVKPEELQDSSGLGHRRIAKKG